jgi:hypothetical protein
MTILHAYHLEWQLDRPYLCEEAREISDRANHISADVRLGMTTKLYDLWFTTKMIVVSVASYFSSLLCACLRQGGVLMWFLQLCARFFFLPLALHS